jgi:hypothetical protein
VDSDSPDTIIRESRRSMVVTTVVTTAVVIGLRNQRVPCGCLADGVEVGRNSRRRRDADKTRTIRPASERKGQRAPTPLRYSFVRVISSVLIVTSRQ